MIKPWRRLVLITWVGWIGKTTLQNILIQKYWWNKPVSFTTRPPRSEDVSAVDWDGDYFSRERDEYVFLSKENFLKKLWNWDFLEMTFHDENTFYWVSRFLPDGDVCIVVDPVGRAQIMNYFISRWYEVETYYIEGSEKLQEERLIERWDTEKWILRKKRDFLWFSPTNKCVRLSGKKSPSELADVIQNRWNNG